SAGGHLVSLLATDPTYLNEPALKLTPADRAALRGVISVSGVYVVPGPDECAKLAEGMANSLLADAGVRLTWQPPANIRSSELLKMGDCNHNSILFRVPKSDNPTAEAMLRYLKRHGLEAPAPKP